MKSDMLIDCDPQRPDWARWTAIREGYEPGEPMGTGKTEEEAIADLIEQEADRGT